MRGNRQNAEAAKAPCAASQPGTVPVVHYIAPASVADVLFEQFEYLAAHAAQSCRRGCEDCARLAQIKDLLLMPFLSSRTGGSDAGEGARPTGV